MASQPGNTGDVWRQCGYYNWGAATGILGVETRDAAQYPTACRMAPAARTIRLPTVYSAQGRVGYPDLHPNTLAEGISLCIRGSGSTCCHAPRHVAKLCLSFLARQNFVILIFFKILPQNKTNPSISHVTDVTNYMC